jgi:hypothetical protein
MSSPLEGDDWYLLERQSWPDHTPRSTCQVVLPEGWGNAVIASPRGDLAAVRWFEQDAAGFVLVAVQDSGDCHLPTHGHRVAATNLMQGPVFSPDGRYLTLSCGRSLWWTGDPDGDDPAIPARGGHYLIGQVAIYDVATEATREIPIEVDVPAGWLPDDPEEPLDGKLLGTPQFVTVSDFTVTLPTGGERRFSVDDVA